MDLPDLTDIPGMCAQSTHVIKRVTNVKKIDVSVEVTFFNK
jgi:hypothetical protein